MEKDKTDPKSTEPIKKADEEKKDITPEEKEEPEYVGLPDRDLKKNLGCG
jgi:hypothetical protein